ncbi:conserved unknown protein [Ectocarpus siliculosus]|uniref:EsV-1-7 n=1 Tax=Ectocarpus siliculosus TaxID=2880 RepID=D8LCP3_ECTSI|nr:conserved unknown protein [Ectocarpus siliculosus]|eukprot:CBN79556.1 conserved unknown protein [Ectocarpus siliculosus]
MALFIKKQWKLRGQGCRSPSTASAGDSGLIVSTDPPGNVVPQRSASSKITGQIQHILEAASSLDRPILSEVVLTESTSLDDSASSAISRMTDLSDTQYVASARSARTNAEASFHSGCTKRSRFGIRGMRSMHCTNHRQPDEIDPLRPPCMSPGCRVTPTYSPPGTKPVRCTSHKLEGDVNTNRRRCGEENCNGRPCFVNPMTGVRHCLAHFSDGDTGGLRGMCQGRDQGSSVPCRKYATFSTVKGKPLRCKGHRLADDVDVVNKMCEAGGCGKRPSFSPVGEVAKRCKSHASDGDVNVNGKKCCVLNCTTNVGVNRTRCKEHAT